MIDSSLIDTVQCADIFDLCAQIPDASIDLIASDMPYGTTACAWDSVIPLEPMWREYRRIIKPRGAIVLTASQPFSSVLTASNLSWFRCEWVIRKPAGTGYLNANRQPMKNHEVALVFAKGEHNYYPQMREGTPYRATSGAVGGFVRDKTVGGYLTVNLGERYPLSVIDTPWNTYGLHPTEKPIDVFEYLILTYTREGEVVFDPCCGSGTTALAARNAKRHYICGDQSAEYVAIARDRLRMPFEPRQRPLNDDLSGLPLFASVSTSVEET